jgi:hypothetical protein
LKQVLLFIFILTGSFAKAQKIESIHVNLYTDYINIDGLLSNGRYLPLDTSQLSFTASAGEFKGNSLWIDNNFKEDKVSIKVVLKSNPLQHKEFDIYIKQKPDNERLKTTEEIIDEIKHKSKNKNNRS